MPPVSRATVNPVKSHCTPRVPKVSPIGSAIVRVCPAAAPSTTTVPVIAPPWTMQS
jgi:hypothetical protein